MALNQSVVATLSYQLEAEARHAHRILENLGVFGDILSTRGEGSTHTWKVIFASKDYKSTLQALFQRKSVPNPIRLRIFDPQHQPSLGWGFSDELPTT